MTVGSTRPSRGWSAFLLVIPAVLAFAAGCDSGSDGGSAASTTSVPRGTSRPTVTPRPTVTAPSTRTTVTRPTVPSANVVVVPASIDSTGRTDVTRPLQRFLASVPSGRVITFRKNGRYRIEGTLFLRGRRAITVDGNGATVFARTPGRPDRSQWWVKGGSRIAFRNIVVRGANPDAGTGENAYRRHRETQHGFRFEGVNGVELDDVRVHDVFGDFVYIGRDQDRVPTKNVWIHDSVFARNGRQGIAVTAANNVIIERNRFDQTRRSTIDLEPNGQSWEVSNVFVLNNHVGEGRLLFVASHGQGPVDNVVISGNELVGHALTIDAKAAENVRRSNWVVIDNTSDVTVHSRPMRFFGIDGLVVRGNTQAVTGNDPGVVLNDVCGARVSGNDFGSKESRQDTPECDAEIVVPVPPAIAGRTATGPGAPTSTVPPSTATPSTATPSTATPSTGRGTTSSPSTPPATEPNGSATPVVPDDGDGGLDLAQWIFIALGGFVLLAIVLAVRARRA